MSESCVEKDRRLAEEYVKVICEVANGIKMQSLASYLNRGVAYTHRLCRDSPKLTVDSTKVRVRDYTVRFKSKNRGE